MSRQLIISAFLVVLIGLSAGCRNSRFCGPYTNGCCGFAQSATLPAPQTGSLQIPSLNQGQPYYNPGNGVPTTAQQPAYLVNPNSTAPTPANNSPTLAPSQGWRPVGNNNYSLNPANTSAPQSVLQPTLAPRRAPVNFAANQLQSPSSVRTASSTNGGLSFTDSVNYRSTRIDERTDESRLPATDATSVRAPSGLNTVTAGARLPQAYPIYGTVDPRQPVYSTQSQYAVQNNQPILLPQGYTQLQRSQPTTIAGQVVYGSANPVVYNTYPAPYAQSGTVYNGGNSQILAQSTATYDPQNNVNYGSGWRDRELTARR